MKYLLGVLLVASLSAACSVSVTRTATVDFLMPMAYRHAPPNWTPPDKYKHCKVLDEVVLDNGTPGGLPTVRVDCGNEWIWFHKTTKKIVQMRRWQ